MDNLDPSTYAAVNNANYKTIAELGTLTGALMAQNAASHQKRMDIISESIVSEALGQRAGIDITESQSVRGVVASDLARQVTDAVLAALAVKLTDK